MNNIYLKRAFTIALAVLLALTFTVMTTGQADAKSKKKTVWQVVDLTSTDNYLVKDSTSNSHFTYDEHGLLVTNTQRSDSYSVNTDYKRNSKGAVTESVTTSEGKVSQVTRNTVNGKGLVTVSRSYNVENDKETHHSTTTYKYYKNGKVSKAVTVFPSDPKTKFIETYRKNGKAKTSYTTSPYGTYKYKYNKKGREYKATYMEDGGKGTIRWKYKNDKKGNPVKVVTTDKFTDKNGKKIKTVRTTTYKYKYDKHNNIIKSTAKIKSSGSKKIDTTTSTYKYKKFKVDRKYLKYIDSPAG